MSSHRGLSAVIGTVFLVAVVIGALSYVSYSLEIMGNFSESLIVEESRQQDKQSEAFEISSLDLSDVTLDGVIKNTGELPIELTTLYIDEQGVNDVVQKYTLDAEIAPGDTIDLLDFANIPIDSTTGYNMKIISSRGAVNSFYVNSNGQENIDITMMAIPETLVTDFDATLLMTVVNNMSNNNILVNLTPEDPYSGCSMNPDCTLVTGPEPASYDVLKSGDIAIFKWNYQLSGDDGDTFNFQGAIQNGNPGNSDSATVTIDVPIYAENSGVSLESLGFGSNSQVDNVFVMHDETYGIPAGVDYQLTSLVPDSPGTTLTFDDVSDSWQFMSSNVTNTDAHFPAGSWNASMRYVHDHLPNGMDAGSEDIWEDLNDGGMILHFEDVSPSSGLYDSGQDSTCYTLADHTDSFVSGATWSATGGVNGSGAYYFDGVNDYIQYQSGTDKKCNQPKDKDFSIVFWFKADVQPSNHNYQSLMYIWDESDGGIDIYIGDTTSGNHGRIYAITHDKDSDESHCTGDEPDGNGGENYMDGEWHHFALSYDKSSGTCWLYLDGDLKDSENSSANSDLNWDDGRNWTFGNDDTRAYDYTGWMDDIMMWIDYRLDANEVTDMYEHSYGYNATNIHFTLGNHTNTGTLLNTISYSNDYGLKYGDSGHYAATGDLWDEYRGGNFTIPLPETHFNISPDENRLGFTMEYASGEELYFLLDESELSGTETEEYSLSSYLQPPSLPSNQNLPVFHVWNNDDLKVQFYAFSSGNEGSWLTNQGTRIIFNGTAGNYAGLVDTVSYGGDTVTLDTDEDSPFIPRDESADIVFWPPQKTPNKAQPADDDDRIDAGAYEVTVFLNGYDEDGSIFLRSIDLGIVTVLE